MADNDTIEIDYDERVEQADTDLAIAVSIDGDTVWFPRSMCEIDEAGSYVLCPEWLAYEKGLI
jgi:hypothetical protein